MSLTAYPTLRLKLTMPQALKLQFLPAVPGTNAAASAAAAQVAADAAQAAANTAVAATANKVDKAGDVMTGFLTLSADPTAILHAATKQYVDTHSGSGLAPIGAEYITSTADAALTAERVLTDTSTVTWDRTTPGQIKAITATGGGNVSTSGTPTNGQYAKWTGAVQIQGVAPATVLSDIGALSTTVAASTYQPLDADLTSLAAASATNAIYYRSAANTWATVTIGANLTFAGGTLAATGAGGVVGPPQGRLTLQTNTPVMTAALNSGNVYYTPYVGQFAPLYDGTNFIMTDLGGELTQFWTDTTKSPAATVANTNYDMFLWNDAGTKRCTRGPAWTSDTVRGTGAGTTELVKVKGLWLNAVTVTNGPAAQRATYVGTIRTDDAGSFTWLPGSVASGGGQALLTVWNAYNRRAVTTSVRDSTANWTYNSNTPRAVNASNNWRVSLVSGLAEDSVYIEFIQWCTHAATSYGVPSIGVDSTAVQGHTAARLNQILNATLHGAAIYIGQPSGFHFYQALEYSGATVTFYGQTTNSSLNAVFYM